MQRRRRLKNDPSMANPSLNHPNHHFTDPSMIHNHFPQNPNMQHFQMRQSHMSPEQQMPLLPMEHMPLQNFQTENILSSIPAQDNSFYALDGPAPLSGTDSLEYVQTNVLSPYEQFSKPEQPVQWPEAFYPPQSESYLQQPSQSSPQPNIQGPAPQFSEQQTPPQPQNQNPNEGQQIDFNHLMSTVSQLAETVQLIPSTIKQVSDVIKIFR